MPKHATLVNGYMPPASLGSGTPTSGKVLYGDGTWKTAPAGGPGGEAFPVGSIFLSAVATDPADLLGYGTWTAIGAGRVLIGQDAGDANFDTLGETGGSKTVAAAGTNSAPTFTGSALAAHSHDAGTLAASAHSGSAVGDHAAHTHSVTSNVTVADHAAHTHSVTSNVTVADHASHTHTYTQVPNHVHVERAQGGTTASTTGTHLMTSAATGGSLRSSAASTLDPTGGVATGTTAGPGATLTHAPTNNAVTSGDPSATLTHSPTNNAVTSGNPSVTLTHSVTQPADHTMSGSTTTQSAGTPAGSVSAPTFTGSATSVVQPYLVVKMWQRTA